MRKLSVLLFALIISDVAGAQIKVCVSKLQGGNQTTLPNATVQCWDEDYVDSDAFMTSGTTTSNGCATLNYPKKAFPTYWDYTPGLTNPDIYCKITKVNVTYPHYTPTKINWNQDSLANFGTVVVYPHRNCPSENGCGAQSFWPGVRYLTDFLTGFHEQCDIHDCCYEDCDETKEACDNEFRALMYSKCREAWDEGSVLLANCFVSADGMYEVVNTFAGPNFDAGRSACN